MKRIIILGFLGWSITTAYLIAAMPAAHAAAGQSSAAPAGSRTIWDRPFSEPQAIRGQTAYKKSCTVCHRDDLGGSDGPPLRGLDFFIRWRGQTLAEMLDEIQMTMPMSDPGSLPPQTYLDIMSFLFAANGVPLGTDDLVADTDTLSTILVTEKASQ
jgi:hypothetical protein